MAKVYSIDGMIPVVHPSTYVHPEAVLIGDVIIGPDGYIGPGAVLRGDFGRLTLERGVNIQDNCVLHGFPGTNTLVEEDGHIGHGAILHGCKIGRGALVGMNAVINDDADIGAESIVAAMAFVRAGAVFEPRSLIAGIPAKVLRSVTDDEFAWKTDGTRDYQTLTRRCMDTLTPVDPLTEIDADRPQFSGGTAQPKHTGKN